MSFFFFSFNLNNVHFEIVVSVLLCFMEMQLLKLLTQSNSCHCYALNRFVFYDGSLMLKSCTTYLPIHNSYTFHHKLL